MVLKKSAVGPWNRYFKESGYACKHSPQSAVTDSRRAQAVSPNLAVEGFEFQVLFSGTKVSKWNDTRSKLFQYLIVHFFFARGGGGLR